jgi:beta-glucosidase
MIKPKLIFYPLISGFIFIWLYGISLSGGQPPDREDIISQKVDSLLNLMTLEEKLGQMTLLSSGFTATGPVLREDYEELVREGKAGSILNAIGAEYIRKLQRIAVEDTRLGIPLLFGLDVIHGFRTIFPIPLAEAATWDPQLIEEASRIAATEAAASGLHWTFAPMVDVCRDPRWGRIAESAGEDPYLNSVFARARVRGFQGSDLYDLNTIMATAKHYASYGAAEGGRDYNTVDISERVLREVYLPPFHAAVEEGVGTLMTAFNEYDGVPATGNAFLLNSILREEWGFEGFVVTDYTSIPEMVTHGAAAGNADAVLMALEANVDMDMQGVVYLNELPTLLDEGRISEEQIDRAVRRILRMKYRLGLFDDPYRYSDPLREEQVILKKEFLDHALEVAKKAIVLLKNEDTLLPLSRDVKKIAVVGPLADNRFDPMGSWRAAGRREDTITLLEGIRNYVSDVTEVVYAPGVDFTDPSRDGFEEALRLARDSDVVIAALGERADMSGEAASRATLTLPGIQQEFLKALYDTGTPVVFVVMAGRPLNLSWAHEHIPAIVNAWFLGTQSGNAIAEVLFGEYNPGGKLPATYPRSVGQVPVYYNHKNTGRPENPEDRFTSKYIDSPTSPLYPFGYGLSYTTFAYSNLRPSDTEISTSDSLKVFIDVTNTGPVRGDEVVQLYVRTMAPGITRPVKELKDFKRITIAPGETETIEFVLHPSQLRYYDREMRYTIEPGRGKVFVGTNSRDVLETEFEILPA